MAAPTEDIRELRRQLEEAQDMLEAIRTGQVDALIVEKTGGPELYALETADRAYRLFIEKMSEGAVTVSRSGIILYSNSSFSEIIGRPLTEVFGLHFCDIIAEDDVAACERLFKAGDMPETKLEVGVMSNGENVPVQLSITGSASAEEVYSIIVTDLRSQKNAQKELEEKNQRLEESNRALELSNRDLLQFASVASHDLQEPVRKISMFSNLLSQTLADQENENAAKYISKIVTSAGRMKTLITDMLNYSRLSYDIPAAREANLNMVLSEVLEDLEISITEKNASITTDVLPVVAADPGQMRQVFQNLLTNALKFTRPGVPPVLTITAKKVVAKHESAVESLNGKWCALCVRDNGIGFDPKYKRSIFDLFERLNSKGKFDGTGIGLAIAKKIVERFNGLISANSVLNSGAEFIIILPAAEPNA